MLVVLHGGVLMQVARCEVCKRPVDIYYRTVPDNLYMAVCRNPRCDQRQFYVELTPEQEALWRLTK